MSSTPIESAESSGVRSLAAAFQQTAARLSSEVALRTPGDATSLTWEEYAQRVKRIATGLSTLGVKPGDTVGLMMTNRPEFNLCDTAALHLGATPFSIYNTSSPEQITHLFGNAGNKIVIAERQFVESIQAARSETAVETIICIDDASIGLLTLEELEARQDPSFDFDARWRAVGPEDVATLIYTSGTTGPSKGVEITHANMLAQLRMTAKVLPIQPGDRTISYLPHAHIADRWATHYTQIYHGMTMTCLADPRAIAAALPEVRPTVWGAVPRIWEKIKAALEAQGISDTRQLPEEVKAGIRQKIGLDQLRWACCGAAPIPVEVLDYFTHLGLTISELWGMSEMSCCVTINPLDDIRAGTVGKLLPGLELQVAEDGEVLVRGPTVMHGYRNMPEKTAETINTEGWLATGDIGTLDDDGYVRIVDRKKELIINAAGKNMSPANIERVLKTSSAMIGQAIVIGDARPYNVALLVLDPDACAAYAQKVGAPDASVESIAAREDIVQLIETAMQSANERLSRVEQIKKYQILPNDWLPGGDELTPTMKLKRKPIANKYAEVIESMYAN